jgi:hypothetical protein
MVFLSQKLQSKIGSHLRNNNIKNILLTSINDKILNQSIFG